MKFLKLLTHIVVSMPIVALTITLSVNNNITSKVNKAVMVFNQVKMIVLQ